MPRVKLSKSTRVLMYVLQFYVVVLFVLIVVRFLKIL
jgi:hypothetical protein